MSKETQLPGHTSYSDRIVICEKYKKHIILVSQISWIKATKFYTVFFLSNGEQVISSRNIGYHLKELDPRLFLRIHRSHAFNFKELQEYDPKGRGGLVKLNCGTILEVSYRLKDKFEIMYNELLWTNV